jgi:hypothetical protein
MGTSGVVDSREHDGETWGSVKGENFFACCLLHAGFLFCLLFNPEYGGDMFFRSVG